jgi:hypothetical protein
VVLVTSALDGAGIVSERDATARKVVLILGRTSKTTPVREIMTTDVVSVEPGFGLVDQCMALMDRPGASATPRRGERSTCRSSSRSAMSSAPSSTSQSARDQVALENYISELTRMVPVAGRGGSRGAATAKPRSASVMALVGCEADAFRHQ